MIYLELFASFFKIGLFSFGGGYAMISLISDEITKHHWIVEAEFIRIIGIAEMTPGPIAINSATFVGYKTAGFLGAFSATLGVTMPSLIIILSLSTFLFKNVKHPLMNNILRGLKPVIAGLVIVAAVAIAKTTLFENKIYTLGTFNYQTFLIAMIILGIEAKIRLNPIILIILSGILGALTLLI